MELPLTNLATFIYSFFGVLIAFFSIIKVALIALDIFGNEL